MHMFLTDCLGDSQSCRHQGHHHIAVRDNHRMHQLTSSTTTTAVPSQTSTSEKTSSGSSDPVVVSRDEPAMTSQMMTSEMTSQPVGRQPSYLNAVSRADELCYRDIVPRCRRSAGCRDVGRLERGSSSLLGMYAISETEECQQQQQQQQQASSSVMAPQRRSVDSSPVAMTTKQTADTNKVQCT